VFTRGTVIPLNILISCADPQALDLLSHPSAISVRLFRHVCHEPSATIKAKSGRFEHSGRSRQRGDGKGKSMTGVDFKVVGTSIDQARFWPALEPAPSADTRRLDGEILLPISLKPTTRLGHWEIWVCIAFFPLWNSHINCFGNVVHHHTSST
jgi:hypothetical protein